ncbi:MAG: GtrA family protein [Actinomycetes bacterium]
MGFASLIVDVSVLVAMRDIAATPLWIATSTGFAAAFVVNFGLNMTWVFSASGRLAPRLLNYTLLVVLNYVITLTIVLGIASLGVSYLVAKAVAVAVCVALNFILYRTWVFA